MMLSIVVACSENGVIGSDNSLPWHLPEDLRHFKALTMGKPLVMGRKTFDSIGRPLPGRTTLVVTRQRDWQREGVITCNSLESALATAQSLLTAEQQEVMVVGGEDIYRQCLPQVARIYLTKVAATVAGDAFFPAIRAQDWRTESEEKGYSTTANLHYSFMILGRRSQQV